MNPDGSIAAGDGFTVQKGAAGVYTLTFALGFRLLAVNLTTLQGGYLATGNAVPGERTLGVSVVSSNAWAASDQGWMFTATGIQQ